MNKRLQRQTIALGALMGIVLVIGLIQLVVNHQPGISVTDATCKKQLALVKYRSELLAAYKQSQDGQYAARRKPAVTLISYAAQWVPQDAAATRNTLYKYDALHATTDRELNKQIKAYRYLQNTSLDCSAGQRANLTAKLVDIRGLQHGKAVGGNALINRDTQAEANFIKHDFNPSNAHLLTTLHQQKAKQPKPLSPALNVKTI